MNLDIPANKPGIYYAIMPRLRKVLLASIILLMGGECRGQDLTPSDQSLMMMFNKAIYEASVYKKANIRPLIPLKTAQGSSSVLVATLTSNNYSKGDQFAMKDLWVTVVPEVKEKCRHFKANLKLQLRQLLGLHPSTPIKNFVIIKVDVNDVFRPTPNPETSTPSPCGSDLSETCGERIPLYASDHAKWMAFQMLSSYLIAVPEISDGYPWTRLGYTYNWAPNADRYGASEYVIRKGSPINITAVVPYYRYCEVLGK